MVDNDYPIYGGSGSVGDLFLILLKLRAAGIERGSKLLYGTESPKNHRLMQELAQCFFPLVGVEFTAVDNLKERSLDIILSKTIKYVSPRYLRDEDDLFSISQIPDFWCPPFVLQSEHKKIVRDIVYIHQETGQPGGNLKRISGRSITKLVKTFPKIKFVVGVKSIKDSRIRGELRNIELYEIGGRVAHWYSLVARSKIVITTEGFPCFVALSSAIPTVWFTRHRYVLNRMRPEWGEISFPIIGSELNNVFTRTLFTIKKQLGVYPKYSVLHPKILELIGNLEFD